MKNLLQLAVCRLFFILIVSLGLTAFALHPFYVSVTDIQYNNKEQTLEISCKLFTNDLETALKKEYAGQKIDLLHPADPKNMEQLLNRYLQKSLSIQISGERPVMQWLGYEQEEECILVYYECKEVRPFGKFMVTDKLLHGHIPDQINIIHVTNNGVRKSTKLNYPASTAIFEF